MLDRFRGRLDHPVVLLIKDSRALSPYYGGVDRSEHLIGAGLMRALCGPLHPRPENAAHLIRNDVAFVYGSIAKGTEHAGSDVDLMVIGSVPSNAQLLEALLPAQASA